MHRAYISPFAQTEAIPLLPSQMFKKTDEELKPDDGKLVLDGKLMMALICYAVMV